MDDHITTYTKGFELLITKPISTATLVRICEDINIAFQQIHPEYTCEPERISEGGIIMTNFPGKKDNMYKSMRLRFENYPFVPPNVMEVWKNDTTVIHCPSMLKCGKENRIQTFLKAFEYAPRWTDQELLIFKNVFAEYGMIQHGRKYAP